MNSMLVVGISARGSMLSCRHSQASCVLLPWGSDGAYPPVFIATLWDHSRRVQGGRESQVCSRIKQGDFNTGSYSSMGIWLCKARMILHVDVSIIDRCSTHWHAAFSIFPQRFSTNSLKSCTSNEWFVHLLISLLCLFFFAYSVWIVAERGIVTLPLTSI